MTKTLALLSRPASLKTERAILTRITKARKRLAEPCGSDDLAPQAEPNLGLPKSHLWRATHCDTRARSSI